jgi:23S rRNA pseudouridine1911/1915/1917 synthase
LEGRILFEDNHLIVINKKAGELVQGDITGDQPLVELVKSFLKKNTINLAQFSLVLFIDWIDQPAELFSLQKLLKHYLD